MAWMFAGLWFGAMVLLFRVAPAPEPEVRAAPMPVSWWPAEGGGDERDIRTLWTPSIFALSTPAGFSHALRRERSRLAPPVQPPRASAAFLENPRPAAAFDLAAPERLHVAEEGARSEPRRVGGGVFPPRSPERETPGMVFPEGWESRLFFGIDRDFGAWTNQAWTARVELRFDAKGVPALALLAQSSGIPEVDRRLARSASGWRLLEPAAPRAGVVAWSSPGAPSAVAAGKGAP